MKPSDGDRERERLVLDAFASYMDELGLLPSSFPPQAALWMPTDAGPRLGLAIRRWWIYCFKLVQIQSCEMTVAGTTSKPCALPGKAMSWMPVATMRSRVGIRQIIGLRFLQSPCVSLTCTYYGDLWRRVQVLIWQEDVATGVAKHLGKGWKYHGNGSPAINPCRKKWPTLGDGLQLPFCRSSCCSGVSAHVDV